MPETTDLDDMEEEQREQVKQDLVKKKEEQMKVVPYVECGISYVDIRNEYSRG